MAHRSMIWLTNQMEDSLGMSVLPGWLFADGGGGFRRCRYRGFRGWGVSRQGVSDLGDGVDGDPGEHSLRGVVAWCGEFLPESFPSLVPVGERGGFYPRAPIT